ncbi:MAG: hypothetical protein ACFBSC_13690 [Microcoleaceae cyanobacterium]
MINPSSKFLSLSVIVGLMQPLAVADEPELFQPSLSQVQHRAQTTASVERGLTITAIEGQVTVNDSPAQVGQQLQVGDRVATAEDSRVDLEVDSNIGQVELAESTLLEVNALDGEAGTNIELIPEQITVLSLAQGQILCSVSRFVSAPFWSDALPPEQQQQSVQNSSFRIETPAGLIGVQGTTFGVNVAPDGQTGVHTIEGTVGVISGEQTVKVEQGQLFVLRPPAEPFEVTEDSSFPLIEDVDVIRLTPRTVRLRGQVTSAGIVSVEDQPVATDSRGQFEYIGRLPASRRLAITVRGPSVQVQQLVITVP